MIIRNYESSDLIAMTKLMGELGYPATVEMMSVRMKKIQNNEMYETFVAILDDAVAGMVGLRLALSYESDEPIAQISALVVSYEHRGRGIGKALVVHAEKWAKSKGARGVFLTSGNRPDRARAHQFYEKMGYKNTGFRFVKASI